MHIHARMTGLRVGLPAQPLTDAALARWREAHEIAPVLAGLQPFDAGAALGDVPALACLFEKAGATAALTQSLIGALTPALAAEPLAQLPLGHSASPAIARIRLATYGRSSLTLAAHAPRAQTMPATALFEDGVSHEIVIAGDGRALVHRFVGERLTSREVALAPGTWLSRCGAEDARQIIAAAQPLLVLQLTREAARALPSREIALANGKTVKTISGCKVTSQRMMALAVLGALRHQAGIPAIACLARDQASARDLRWEALRQCLALDSRTGLTVLAALAGDKDDTLATPAAALQRQLQAARPDLAVFIAEPA